MAPHIVSWGVSPVVSSTGAPSVIPLESLLSGSYPKSPNIPEAWRARTTEPGSRPTSFLGTSESEAQDGSHQKSDDSFQQHSKYFFKDGNVTFLVDGILYCVHRYFFSRDSAYFSTRFSQLGVHDHEASSTIVSLGDVECKDFEAFLSVLYPENFEEHDLSYEQWKSILHLSTRWGFASLRALALRSIEPPTVYDRLVLARTYAVDHWIVPALTALCEREMPLSLDEARGMGMEDVVLVATVREDIRSKAIRLGVSPAEISQRVEAMQAGRPWIPERPEKPGTPGTTGKSGTPWTLGPPVADAGFESPPEEESPPGEVIGLKPSTAVGVKPNPMGGSWLSSLGSPGPSNGKMRKPSKKV